MVDNRDSSTTESNDPASYNSNESGHSYNSYTKEDVETEAVRESYKKLAGDRNFKEEKQRMETEGALFLLKLFAAFFVIAYGIELVASIFGNNSLGNAADILKIVTYSVTTLIGYLFAKSNSSE